MKNKLIAMPTLVLLFVAVMTSTAVLAANKKTSPTSEKEANSILRISCDGDDVGAEVQINGKFRGECPVDITLSEGTYKLRVLKKVDDEHERVFEQEVRIGDGNIKKVEAVLTTRLNAIGQKREDERLAFEKAEVLKRKNEAKKREEDRLLAEEKSRADFKAELASDTVKAGRIFRSCTDCPDMVVILSGNFEMGSISGGVDEIPVHRVEIAKKFALGKTEVTQGQWKALMGNNPSEFKSCGDNCPVEHVSWNDAQAFILKLNARTGETYRLPSEAEWEYAVRAGSNTLYPWGEKASHEYANYGEDRCCGGFMQGRDKWLNTAPVGSFSANAFGLFDMIGNVWEWVEDSYHDSYKNAPTDGKAWQGDGLKRVLRGGAWADVPEWSTSARRVGLPASGHDMNIGFRLAKTL